MIEEDESIGREDEDILEPEVPEDEA